MEISGPEQALEAETKSPEAPAEAEPITEQPQKNEDVGQTANADKAPEKVTFDIPRVTLDSVMLKLTARLTQYS